MTTIRLDAGSKAFYTALGLIVEELGLDDGVKVLQQLGIIPNA